MSLVTRHLISGRKRIPPRYLFGGPWLRVVVARLGMTLYPSRTHDPGGVVARFGGIVWTADRDTAAFG